MDFDIHKLNLFADKWGERLFVICCFVNLASLIMICLHAPWYEHEYAWVVLIGSLWETKRLLKKEYQ